jgi:hypothetical protein
VRTRSGYAYRFEQQSEQLKENDTGDQVVDAEDPLTEASGVLAMTRRMQRETVHSQAGQRESKRRGSLPLTTHEVEEPHAQNDSPDDEEHSVKCGQRGETGRQIVGAGVVVRQRELERNTNEG